MGNRYQDLVIWQRAMDIAALVYRVSSVFPREELYGLTAQVRRAAVSVPSNIAEGHGRLQETEFRHFLGLARGSLRELATQARLAVRLGFVPDESVRSCLNACGELARMLNRFLSHLPKPSERSPLGPQGRRVARSPSASADV